MIPRSQFILPSPICNRPWRSLFIALGLTLSAATLAFAQALPGPPEPKDLPKDTTQGPPPPDVPTGPPVTPLAPSKDAATTVVARVNGAPIFQNELEAAVNNLTHGKTVDSNTLAMVQATALQQSIDKLLVRQYLAAQKMQGTDAEVDVAENQLKATLQQQKVTLDDFLARTHQTESSLRTMFSQELGWKKFAAKNSTDDAMQVFFKQFHEQFDGTQRRVSHILLRPDGILDQDKFKVLLEKAKTLREQIASGQTTFEDAAEKYSAGPSRTHGGDLGFIPRSGVMIPQFSEVAFALKPGDVSPPVATMYGVHLIKVTDVKTGTKTWDQVREELLPPMADFLFNQLAKQLLDKSTIDYASGVPHFKKGTREVEASQDGTSLQ